jgi:hypothetical protein
VTTDVTPELAEAIQRGYDQRDGANMAPTIAYFQALLAEHPDHPVLVYEVGGAYDTAGQELGVTVAGAAQFAAALTGATAINGGLRYVLTVTATVSYDGTPAAVEVDTGEDGLPGIVLRLIEHDPGTRARVLLDAEQGTVLAGLLQQALAYLAAARP